MLMETGQPFQNALGQLYLLFVCLTGIALQKSDDIAIGKTWKDQNRNGSIFATQSKDTTDVWMNDPLGNLEILIEALRGNCIKPPNRNSRQMI